MPFADLNLHPSLLRAIKELGYARPTPIQAEAIPPAMAGRDVLACAMTGSGKTAAFLLPILHKLIDTPRGATRALVLTPTRELAAQILESVNELAMHTPVTGAVGLRRRRHGPAGARAPQRRRHHHRDARPAARSHAPALREVPGAASTSCSTRPTGCSTWASCRTSAASSASFPRSARRCSSARRCRRRSRSWRARCCHDPAQIQLERKSAPATGITQAVYPVPQELKSALLATLLERGDMRDTLVFTRTKHRANRLHDYLVRRKVSVERIHGNRSQPQRTAAARGVQERADSGARGDRHRRARHRRRARSATS